jgi:predicted PurR-regulated permease PerM
VASDDARPRDDQRVTVRVTVVSALLGMGIVVLAMVGQRIFVAAHRPLSWAAAAAVAAVLLDPIVGVIGRRISRPFAVLLVLLVVGGAAFGVVYRAIDEINNGLDRMGEAAQEAAADLEQRDGNVGDLSRDVEARRRVDDFVEALEDRATGGDEVLRSTAGTAPTYLIGAILTIFLLSYGPRLAGSALEQVRGPVRRERTRRIVLGALVRARRAVLFTLGEGVVAGVAVGLVAAALGIPAPAALGLSAGVLTILPHVGLVLGCLPFLLLMLSQYSDSATFAALLVVFFVQMVDSTHVRPALADRSVHVGLLVPWAVALVGYAVYGIGGAAYGMAFAVFGLALIDERQRVDELERASADTRMPRATTEADVAESPLGAAALPVVAAEPTPAPDAGTEAAEAATGGDADPEEAPTH